MARIPNARFAPQALLLLPVLLVVLSLSSTGSSLLDPDVWWHVATGRLVLDSGAVPSTDPWSFTAPPDSWVPTAWLSDVLFAVVWKGAGYEGIRVLRIGLALAVISAVALTANRLAPQSLAAPVATALTALALQPFLRERPQVIAYLFVVLLGLEVHRVLQGSPPRVLGWVGLTWLWSNVHGMWPLAPALLLLAGVLSWWDDRSRVPLAARCTLAALGGGLSTMLTPVGPELAYWPLRVQRAAAPISEWAPPTPLARLALPLTVALVLIALSWRAGNRASTGRCAYVVAVGAFGFTAWRNTAPAVILLLPELVFALRTLLPASAGKHHANRYWAPAAVATGAVAATATLLLTPTVDSRSPLGIVARLQASPEPLRVLNHYDVGGLITGLASPPARVAIDGRTDMWSPGFVREYLETLSAQRDWRPLVDRLRPDAAVLATDSEIVRGLVRERGWSIVMTDGRWALLVPENR